MSGYIDVAIRGLAETVGWKFGEAFINSLKFEGGVSPEQISNNPDRFKKDSPGFDMAQDFWACKGTLNVSGGVEFYQDFAWRRKKNPKFSGWIRHKSKNLRGAILPSSIRMILARNCSSQWLELFKVWCCLTNAQLAMLHLFTDQELSMNGDGGFKSCGFNALLNPTFSGLGWVLYLGKDKLVGVDAEAISNAGFLVDRLGEGVVVRVTEDIDEVWRDFQRFDFERNRLRSMLPDALFEPEI